jgi:4'-phosphopantetheinyl transferase
MKRPHRLAIGREVDVWFVDLADTSWQHGRWLNVLSDEESARAKLFKFSKHRARFRAAHAALRAIIAAYLTREPASIRFVTNAHGKPRLDDRGTALEFNLSHCDALAAVVVSNEAPVGVDVEDVRDLPDLEDVARHFFAPSEAVSILSLPVDARAKAFFRCWTRKEAFVKGCGQGLSIPIHSFDVSPARSGPISLSQPCEGRLARWTLIDVASPTETACAVAIQGGPRHVRCSWWICSD